MRQNIGTADRAIRASIGIILLLLSFYFKSGFLLIFAVFAFYEALASWCVFYQLIGRNTCPINSGKKANFSLLNSFLRGVFVLVGAIILNILAELIHFKTWYDVFLNSASLQTLKIDNILFLFIVYPLFLGILATFNFNRNDKA